MTTSLFNRILTSFIFLFLGFQLISQNVQDFTVVDTEGQSHSLYADYLDQDRVVVIKLYWAGCPPCNSTAKDVQALYEKWEGGAGKVEFIALGTQGFENNTHAQGYIDRHSITFPMISPEGSSLDAIEQFNFFGTPTYIVAKPDKSTIFDPSGLDALDEAIAAAVNDVQIEIPDCPTTDIVINNATDLANYRNQFPKCVDFIGDLTINGNVTDLRGFETLKSVTGTVTIESDALVDLSDLSSLEKVSRALVIKDSENLSSLAGLEKLNNIAGSIELSNLAMLSSLAGLTNLQSITGNLIIDNCTALQSMSGLTNLRNVNGTLSIIDNENLNTLSGLESLTQINGKLEIERNTSLNSIEGISQLSLFNALDLIGNTALTECAVSSLCNLITGDLSIPANISGNGTGCETQEAINNACNPSEQATSFVVQVLDAFDNPVEGVSLSVVSNDGEGVNSVIGESNSDGSIDFQLPNNEISDIENLSLVYTEPSGARISGVSVIDVVRIQNHIIGRTPITNPYVLLAADANGNGSVSVTDLVFILNVIVGKRSNFGDVNVFRVINESCAIDNVNCTNTPLSKNPGNQTQIRLRAVRVGDING